MKQMVRKNNIIAIETRTGLFVLAQSIGNGAFVFFNYFSTNMNEFDNIDLENMEVLCCITSTKRFNKKCTKIKTNIKARIDLLDYNKKLNLLSLELNNNLQWKNQILYKGSKDEMEIIYESGDLELVNWKHERLKQLNKKTDKKLIENTQFHTMGEYGELCERLYLSYKYGKFIEPLKELIMGEKLPDEYKIYFKIINGTINEEEYKKLRI